MRFSLTIGAALAFGGAASAQFQPGYGGGYGSGGGYGYGGGFGGGYGAANQNFMPNIYNPQTQPLSPYLNLLRGGNSAVNYYYGVRPGTVGMGSRGFGGAPFIAGGGNRMMFFPQLAAAPDPLSAGAEPTGTSTVLPPAGHPVVFNNTMGFFPSPLGQAGGSRAGLSGVGTTPRRR
jgi:hypothetical protein